VSLGNLFKLAKLTIKSFEDIERQKPLRVGLRGSNALEVMYNPETLSTKHASVFQQKRGVGSGATPAHWLHSGSRELSVKLIFDGTSVSSFGIDQLLGIPTVAELVAAFLKLCFRVEPKSHEPAYLTLVWGTGVLGAEGFECRAESVDIQYTLFDRDGSPLRAELNCKFVEAVDAAKKSAQLRLSSPDLTHYRVVKAGDTLPLLCREVYGSAEHYLRVAAVNGLDDFRTLEPGLELMFPPFARKRKERD
jgi:nucleoid-associated protein YgaU